MKWEAPLQEVAPQHEGRGSTPPNEGWSGAPCGTPSGTFIRRWKSISCGRASPCLGSDMFNLGPYENTRPPLSWVRGLNNTGLGSRSLTKWLHAELNYVVFSWKWLGFDTPLLSLEHSDYSKVKCADASNYEWKVCCRQAIIEKMCSLSQVSFPSIHCILLHLFGSRQK